MCDGSLHQVFLTFTLSPLYSPVLLLDGYSWKRQCYKMVRTDSSKVFRKYFERSSMDSESPLQDPLRFDPEDSTYRIWCGCHVVHAFLCIAPVQLFLATLLLVMSGLHLCMSEEEEGKGPHTSTVPLLELNATEGTWRKRLFFEPSDALVYLRITVACIHIAGLMAGFHSVWKQRSAYLVLTVWANGVVVVASFGYFILLAFHSLVQEDYFAFCFVGLSLLFVMLMNVLSAQVTWELINYFKDLSGFLSTAKRRWPSVERDALDRSATSERMFGCFSKVSERYMLSRALVSRARMETNDGRRRFSVDVSLDGRQEDHCCLVHPEYSSGSKSIVSAHFPDVEKQSLYPSTHQHSVHGFFHS